jgi:hypothetical protein
MRRSRSWMVAVLVVLMVGLLAGCELREGPKSEYGESAAHFDRHIEKPGI